MTIPSVQEVLEAFGPDNTAQGKELQKALEKRGYQSTEATAAIERAESQGAINQTGLPGGYRKAACP